MGRNKIADIVGVEVISLDDAPRGYGEFDAGVPKKFVIDPHKLFSGAWVSLKSALLVQGALVIHGWDLNY